MQAQDPTFRLRLLRGGAVAAALGALAASAVAAYTTRLASDASVPAHLFGRDTTLWFAAGSLLAALTCGWALILLTRAPSGKVVGAAALASLTGFVVGLATLGAFWEPPLLRVLNAPTEPDLPAGSEAAVALLSRAGWIGVGGAIAGFAALALLLAARSASGRPASLSAPASLAMGFAGIILVPLVPANLPLTAVFGLVPLVAVGAGVKAELDSRRNGATGDMAAVAGIVVGALTVVASLGFGVLIYLPVAFAFFLSR